MCIGENSAPHAEHYLNAQLGALWENAVECVTHHGKGLKPHENQKYSFALAEYYYGKHRSKGQASKEDMMFYASFGKPRIEFICNHDAIIHLTLKEGHYNTDFAKATSSQVSAHHERNRSFSNLKASFRVPFGISGLRHSGKDTKIGGGNHVIKLFMLELQKAHMISITPEDADVGKQALSFYLLHYLRFLTNAGHHVLFSLPDFDDDDLSISIDFSTMSSATVPVDEIRGVSIEKINAFLSTAWLKAAMLAATERTATDSKVALAEYRSTYTAQTSDTHFHVKLGAPRVTALCDQEVVLYFTLDDLSIYETEDFNTEPRHSFQNWEIAVLVNVVTSTEEEGNVTRCNLDFETGRFVRHYCNFPGLDEANAEAVRCWTRVVEFFTTSYFDILESAQYNVIYHHDHRWPKPEPIPPTFHGGSGGETVIEFDDEEEYSDDQGGIGGTIDIGGAIDGAISGAIGGAIGGTVRKIQAVEWKQISEKADMAGFDQIMAVSQAGIIAHFLHLWNTARTSKEATLQKWSYDDYFEATFKPMTLRLLSNGRAIVWVHLQDGFLRTLRNWLPWSEGAKYNFEDWSLAFEVDIKMCNHAELHDMSSTWYTKFESSHAYKEHGQASDRVLKHIYLDFRAAEFVHEFSSFEGLFQSSDKRPIDKVQAIVTYLKNHYFQQITSSGYHIINTIPVWKAGSTPPSYGLTSVAFHIYSKHVLERHTWGAFSKTEEPVIIILGMTGFRPLPSLTLKFSTNWIVQAIKGVSYGTVSLSKSVFMDQRLLSLLARVNALTTIVPLFAGVDNGAWRLELTTWAKHEIRKNHLCKWVPVKEEDGLLKYKWEHRDEWSYEHEGSDHITNGIYTTSCITKNYLEIPTVFARGSLQIKVKGDVSVRMGYKSAAHTWSTQASASWSTALVIKSDINGLKVEMVGSSAPVFRKTEATGSKMATVYTDPETLLKSQLPGTIELSEVLKELKHFEGAWHTCYPGLSAYELTQPIFNQNGDLLFKLRPFGVAPRAPSKAAVSVTTTTHANGNGSVVRHGTSSSIVKSRPSLHSQHSRSSFLHKVKEIAHTVLVGEHTHSPGPSNGKKQLKKKFKSDSSDTTSDDEGDATERESFVDAPFVDAVA